MNLLVPLLAPLLLLLPAQSDDASTEEPRLSPELAKKQPGRSVALDWLEIAAPFRTPNPGQVRIEQRVILRISPHPSASRQNLAASLPVRRGQSRLVERPFGECLPIADIAAVQAHRGNRLLLYLRDRRLIAANLEKACSAQNYYSGFYLEQNQDRRLCVGRDRLQARNGTKCSVSSLRQIVAVAED